MERRAAPLSTLSPTLRGIAMRHGSEKRVRTAHLTIRLSPDERSAIDGAAERSGLTPGSYARQAVLGAPPPRQVRRPPVERQELARLLGELGHVGGNLNQIARGVNLGNGVDAWELRHTLASLGLVRGAILKALGRDA
jgi:hypothetical protein